MPGRASDCLLQRPSRGRPATVVHRPQRQFIQSLRFRIRGLRAGGRRRQQKCRGEKEEATRKGTRSGPANRCHGGSQ
jgi:hypothetical protein